MKCPLCGNKVRTTNSRPMADNTMTRRRKVCSCGWATTSIEIVVGDNTRGGPFAGNEEGAGWSALIRAVLPKLSSVTMLNEIKRRIESCESLTAGDQDE